MMKRVWLFLLVISCVLYTLASPVDPEMARQVAEKFLTEQGQFSNVYKSNQSSHLKRVIRTSTKEESSSFYIFNNIDNNTFIIVSGDNCATPILGYSTENYIDIDNLPKQFEDLLQVYDNEIQYAIDNNLQASDSILLLWQNYISSSQSHQATAVVNALISTKWNQSPYYNILCPSDPTLSPLGGHPSTGCVATAMAQIMKYWEYPQRGIGYKRYNSDHYGTLNANFAITTYDWDNMPLKLSAASSSIQDTAIATLMYHCGVSVEMNYNSDGNGSSGAFVCDIGGGKASAETALKKYFGYASTICGVSSSSMSAIAWKNLLKNELDNHRPILYAGFSSSGGHAFICDGYDSADNFHFNWGWGGNADGYFSLSALAPSRSVNYSNNQQALIGISPKDGSIPAQNFDLYMNTDLKATKTISTSSGNQYHFGKTISFSAKVENNGTGIFNGNFKVGIFDNNNEFVAWSNEVHHYSLLVGRTTSSLTFNFDGGYPFIPGKYRAYLYYQEDNDDAFKLVKNDVGIFLTEYNNVAFSVMLSDDLLLTSAYNFEFGSFTSGSRVRISVNVKNSALLTRFNGKIRLSLYNIDGSLAEIIAIEDYTQNGISTLTTIPIEFVGVIDVEPGTYYLALTYQKQGQSLWYYLGCSNTYLNPTKVIVTAPKLEADCFEMNNTLMSATLLNWEINEEIWDFSTLQASIHEDSDIDFYKLVFPDTINYNIHINLYDKFNKGSMWYENAIVKCAYTINATTYSDYKNSHDIELVGPTTIYIVVKPLDLNGLGYYELNGDIKEFTLDAIEETLSERTYMTKTIIDGHIYVISRDGKVYDLMGRLINY